MADAQLRRGIYDSDYFSGAQVALYIGDVWVDEVTSLNFSMSEPKVPLHGYSDVLYRDISRGQVSIEGQFTINFKEAGYLWLILNRYQELVNARQSPLFSYRSDQKNELANEFNIEETYIVDAGKAKAKNELAKKMTAIAEKYSLEYFQRKLTGFASTTRETGGMGSAEDLFEKFENEIWDGTLGTKADQDAAHRRVTDKRLNPFDIYILYGDYVGDDKLHHTVQKLSQVSLTGVGKQIVIDGQPIQEAYTFIARDLV